MMLAIDCIISYYAVGSQAISFVRYCVYFTATYYLLKGLNNNYRKPSLAEFLLLLWAVYIIFGGFIYTLNVGFNTPYFKQFISGLCTLYLVPFLMISNLSSTFLKKYFILSYYLAILSILLLSIDSIAIFGSRTSIHAEIFTYFATGVSFLLMTYPYHGKKKIFVIFTVTLTVIFIMMLLGRRNKVVYFGSILFFALLLNMVCKTYLSKGSKKFKVIGLVLCIVLIVINSFSEHFTYFFERMDTGMSSREGTIELFLIDFNNQPSDWIFGRGMYGSFMGGVLAEDDLTGTRSGIENGYLQLILKGGWIWLGLLIFISIKALYLGLFKSKNLLCKGMALVILVYYIDMIGFGIPTLYLGYINVFIAISGCNTKWLRDCTDAELQPHLNLK